MPPLTNATSRISFHGVATGDATLMKWSSMESGARPSTAPSAKSQPSIRPLPSGDIAARNYAPAMRRRSGGTSARARPTWYFDTVGKGETSSVL